VRLRAVGAVYRPASAIGRILGDAVACGSYPPDVNEQRIRTYVPVWLAGVAMTGVTAFVLAAAILWMLVSRPAAIAGAEPPAIALALGRWAWHLIRLMAAWM